MRNLILPLLIFLASCNPNNETKEKQPTKTDHSVKLQLDTVIQKVETNPLLSIKKNVEQINNSKLIGKHFEFKCDELMKVDYYYNDGKLVKIAVDFGTIGDVYAKEDYYYANGKLIFKYEFVAGGPACEGCSKTNEYRSYIINNKVIKYLKDDEVAACRKCEFIDQSKENSLYHATNTKEIKAILCR